MTNPKRKNIPCVVKTFRFDPKWIQDAEHILFLTGDKYSSMTNFIVVAVNVLIKKERKVLEDEGVAWDHLKPPKEG